MTPNPSLFSILNASIAVKALMGSNPLRIFPWGEAPEGVAKPYAVYSVYNANPENYLDSVPDIDNEGTQINVYAETGANASACFKAIRDALEPHAHMVNYSTPTRDENTKLYECRLEFDFWETR